MNISTLNYLFLQQMGKIALKQNTIPNQGFDDLTFNAAWVEKDSTLKLSGSRNGKDGKMRGAFKVDSSVLAFRAEYLIMLHFSQLTHDFFMIYFHLFAGK